MRQRRSRINKNEKEEVHRCAHREMKLKISKRLKRDWNRHGRARRRHFPVPRGHAWIMNRREDKKNGILAVHFCLFFPILRLDGHANVRKWTSSYEYLSAAQEAITSSKNWVCRIVKGIFWCCRRLAKIELWPPLECVCMRYSCWPASHSLISNM